MRMPGSVFKWNYIIHCGFQLVYTFVHLLKGSMLANQTILETQLILHPL